MARSGNASKHIVASIVFSCEGEFVSIEPLKRLIAVAKIWTISPIFISGYKACKVLVQLLPLPRLIFVFLGPFKSLPSTGASVLTQSHLWKLSNSMADFSYKVAFKDAGLSDHNGCRKKKVKVTTSTEEAEGTYGKENLRESVKERELDQLDNRLTGRISCTLPKLNVHDAVGASPVEIAKAFMGNRASVLGSSSQSGMIKDEIVPSHGVEFASKSVIPSPVRKLPTCWPGAMVHEDCSYLTPQTQRDRLVLHYLPRTPYSGAVHLRSNSELWGSGGRPLNLSSTNWKKNNSSIFGDGQMFLDMSVLVEAQGDLLDNIETQITR